jgi:hypothetical protein
MLTARLEDLHEDVPVQYILIVHSYGAGVRRGAERLSCGLRVLRERSRGGIHISTTGSTKESRIADC